MSVGGASFVTTLNGDAIEGSVSETRSKNFSTSMNKSLILFSLSIARKAAAPAKKVVAKKVATKKVAKAAPAKKVVAKKAAAKKVVAKKAAPAKKAAKKVVKKAAKK